MNTMSLNLFNTEMCQGVLYTGREKNSQHLFRVAKNIYAV